MVQLCSNNFYRSLLLPRTLTVSALTEAAADSALTEVVRSQLNRHFVAWNDAYEVLPHFTCDVRYDSMAIFEFDAKLSTRKGLNNRPRELDHFLVYCHRYIF